VAGDWEARHTESGFTYAAVDGGVIDNDPFEYVVYTLWDHPHRRRAELHEADRGVIMVAPFPDRRHSSRRHSGARHPEHSRGARSRAHDQARFKPAAPRLPATTRSAAGS